MVTVTSEKKTVVFKGKECHYQFKNKKELVVNGNLYKVRYFAKTGDRVYAVLGGTNELEGKFGDEWTVKD